MTGVMDKRSPSRSQSKVETGGNLPMIEVDPSKLQVAPDPSKVGTVKYPLLTHEKVDTKPVKNIEMKQYLGVKHALPKTRLTNAILYENVSQDRHLEMQVRSIASRQGRTSSTMDFNRRAFMAQQDRKRRKWKREDEVRLAGMNLPSLAPHDMERRPSADVMYHSNDTGRGSVSNGRKPILPMMKVRKERTEIIFHKDKTFITKLPSYVHIDENIEKIFEAYRGTAYLSRDLPSRDERFRRLQSTLQPSLTMGDEPDYTLRNQPGKSKMLKYKGVIDSPTNSEPNANQMAEARVMIASRGQSRDMARSAPAVEFVTEKKSASQRRADILHSFKTQDIKELSKSLTRESQIGPEDLKDVKQQSDSKDFSRSETNNIQSVPSLGLQYNVKPK